jgi:hypothetical protein
LPPLLIIGRLFGDLSTGIAALLFAAALLSELPMPRRRVWGLARFLLTAVTVAVTLARIQLVEESNRLSPRPAQAPSQNAVEATLQDYEDFKQK